MSNLRIGRKKYYLRVVVSLLILFVVSCNEKNGPENPENILKQETMQEELTIESAKQWFEQKVAPNSNGRIAANAKKEVLWNFATQGTDQEKDNVIIVPVAVEEKYQSFGIMMKDEDASRIKQELKSKNYKEQGYSTPQKLIMYKDSLGKVHTMLMKIISDYDYFERSLKKAQKEKAKNNGKDYTGTIAFYDWNGTSILAGLNYENGKLKGIHEPNKSTKNGRITGCSVNEYYDIVPCPNAKTTDNFCTMSYSLMVCNYNSFGSLFETTITSMPMFFMNGGGTYVDAISSSYRANQVDNFMAQTSQYGFTFNPDERLDFIDNFDTFIKVRDDIWNAIRTWGNVTVQNLENKFGELSLRGINQQERNLLAQWSILSSYRLKLLMYAWNGYAATNIAQTVMDYIGRDGSVARNCSACRGNAVKHAAWNIKNSDTFGTWFAKQLGDAHEIDQLENINKSMDLHNNSIGISLFNDYGGTAIGMLADILQNGMPNNPSNGFKFVYKETNLVWTKDYPNEN